VFVSQFDFQLHRRFTCLICQDQTEAPAALLKKDSLFDLPAAGLTPQSQPSAAAGGDLNPSFASVTLFSSFSSPPFIFLPFQTLYISTDAMKAGGCLLNAR
jgi:hypothetical protein